MTFAQKVKASPPQKPATPKQQKKVQVQAQPQTNPTPKDSPQGARPKAPRIRVNYQNGTPSQGQSPVSNASNRSTSPSSNSDVCNYCKQEGHRIMYCPERPLCLFCGKRGHTAERCYSAVNRCIRCEVDGHIVEDCPKGRRVLANPTLECPLCNGAHLGKDCKMRIRGLNC